MSPAGLPHAQRLRVGKLALEAEQNPAMTEQQLQAVLTKAHQVLVEARQHQTQKLSQVHLHPECESETEAAAHGQKCLG